MHGSHGRSGAGRPDRVQDVGRAVQVEAAEQLGEATVVELVQWGRSGSELNGMAAGRRHVQVLEVDDLFRHTPGQRTQTEPAGDRPDTNLHCHDLETPVRRSGQEDVSDPGGSVLVEIDDLRVQQVASEQDLVRGEGEIRCVAPDVVRSIRQLDTGIGADGRTPRNQLYVVPTALDDDAGDGGMVRRQPSAQVVQLSEGITPRPDN